MQTSCIKSRCMMDVLKVIFSTNTSKKSIFNTAYIEEYVIAVVYLTSSCVNWGAKCQKTQLTHERVEYNVFLYDEPLNKGSKSVKIFKISLTFRFDKLSNLSKSVHTGENSQTLTMSNKKKKI
jgi:hypothetical protein